MADDPGSTIDKDAAPKVVQTPKNKPKTKKGGRAGVGLAGILFTLIIFFRTWAQVGRQMDMHEPIEAVVASYAQGIFYLLALFVLLASIFVLIRFETSDAS